MAASVWHALRDYFSYLDEVHDDLNSLEVLALIDLNLSTAIRS